MAKYLLIFILPLMLLACGTPPAEQVMKPVAYQQPIDIHSSKVAQLTWHGGKVVPVIYKMSPAANSGIGGVIATALINRHRAKHDRNEVEFKYGNAQQVVFMTSLRDNLVKQNAFSKVKLTGNQVPLKADQVNIDVRFNRTQVVSQYGGFPIEIDATLLVTEPGKPTFERHYHIKPDRSWKTRLFGRSFKKSQTYASSLLMNDVLSGLEEWQQQRG